MRLMCGLILVALASLPAAAKTIDTRSLGEVPVLENGRVKPFDTVARETVLMVAGRERFGMVNSEAGEQKVGESLDSVAMLLDWMVRKDDWEKRPLISVARFDVREKLKMKRDDKWIAPAGLRRNPEFRKVVADVQQRRAAAKQFREEVKLSPVEEELMEIETRLDYFDGAVAATFFGFYPQDKESSWVAIASLRQIRKDLDPVHARVLAAWDAIEAAYKASDQPAFDGAVKEFRSAIEAVAGVNYYNRGSISRELFYSDFKPFRKAWIVYFLALVVLIGSLMIRLPAIYWAGMVVFAGGFAISVMGFVLRSTIGKWISVTNFYESAIWVAMTGALFALVLELVYRRKFLIIAGAVVAIVVMMAADFMPGEYGKNIRNPMPVLRTQFWLAVHVMTIVASYGAFALALVLGNIVMAMLMKRPESDEEVVSVLSFTYRSLQVGLLLCAAGTILGAFWADKAWGRFWGWDPKETWALIVVLFYAGLLHARYIRWIGPFGLAAGAVICFSSVLIAWYGVNYLLGAGLHSYGGNGHGGKIYVVGFCLAQLAFTIVAYQGYRRSKARAELLVA